MSDPRAAVAAATARMVSAGLVVGTAGNISVRAGTARDQVAITPSGLDYAALRAADVGLHGLDGAPIEAPLPPSSELPLHLAVYAATDAGAIVHTHSPAATALGLLIEPGAAMPALHYYAAMFGGPVLLVPYHPFGSPELGAAAATALRSSRGVLLAHHGAVTIAGDVAEALELAVVLEWLCEVHLRAAAAGTPRHLPAEAVEQAGAALASYRAARPRRE